LINASRVVRSRFSPYPSDLLLYPAAVGLGLLAGYSLLMDPTLVKLLLLFPALLFAVTVSPEKLFVGWLFCAPFVQGASSGDHSGHTLFKVLFLVPPLILLARMATGELRRSRLWAVDVLPALYLAYIVVRVQLLPSSFSGSDASLRSVYSAVGIGIIGYYFAAFARTGDRFPARVVSSLLWSAIIIAALALVDAATGWNLWNTDEYGEGTATRRVVSTFTSSGALGLYIGAGVVFSVAILAWKGPRSLRLPAILLIGVAVPALFFTYSRGPVLGGAVVAVFIALVANRARVPSLLLFATVAILVFAVWGQISSSAVYQERLGVTETVSTRSEIQRVTLNLIRQRPLFGWGYNTFDEAKLTVASRDPRFDALSSHSTFLTVLAELGVVGLTLLLLPWIVIAWRAVSATRRGQAEAWIVGACVGVPAAYAIGALTFDTRFFAILTALPWITLGLLRSLLASQRTSIESVQS
jgi:putative inorganic carbon (HCO3(-)) transporter